MGKGTIISGGTGGQYQLQVNYNRVAYDAELAKLATQIIEWGTKISDKEAEIIALENEYTYLVDNGFLPEVLAAKKNEISKAEREKASLTIYKLSFEKRKQYLEDNMPADETVSAWCADLTEDLSGSVGTVEVPGESTYVQIQPGYAGNAVYDGTRDGQLLPTVVSTPAQAFYNLAMLPGWQKWKPLFRYATITAIDGDTANITLENIKSSQQALKINQTDTISGVEIDYMNCDGAAFAVGDEVLVKFTGQAWTAPVIVGFKNNPKSCERLLFLFSYDDSYFLYDGESESEYLLYDENGAEITQPFTTDPTAVLSLNGITQQISWSTSQGETPSVTALTTDIGTRVLSYIASGILYCTSYSDFGYDQVSTATYNDASSFESGTASKRINGGGSGPVGTGPFCYYTDVVAGESLNKIKFTAVADYIDKLITALNSMQWTHDYVQTSTLTAGDYNETIDGSIENAFVSFGETQEAAITGYTSQPSWDGDLDFYDYYSYNAAYEICMYREKSHRKYNGGTGEIEKIGFAYTTNKNDVIDLHYLPTSFFKALFPDIVYEESYEVTVYT